MSRPIVATIDNSALRQNLKMARQAAPDARIWSVIKANAYGHGINRVREGLLQSDGFALLELNEAVSLRESGWEKPVLLLEGFFHAKELPIIDHYRLTCVVHSEWQIEAIAKAKLVAPLDIYVKINSGMNRLGFQPGNLRPVWNTLRGLNNVAEMTLMAHFAEAGNAENMAASMQRINQASEGLHCPRSLANSAATLWHPQAHFDWVRPGILLYGASPTGRWQDIHEHGLCPVMTLNSEIIAVQRLQPGSRVGYGARYHAQKYHRIGIVACGYADGYPRHAPTGTPVMVEGIRTQTLGAVSMDMLAVDLSPCQHAGVGSEVELWGGQIKIDEVASAAGTVGYELMCALAARVSVTVC